MRLLLAPMLVLFVAGCPGTVTVTGGGSSSSGGASSSSTESGSSAAVSGSSGTVSGSSGITVSSSGGGSGSSGISPSSSGGSSSGGSGALTPAELVQQIFDAYCDREDRCAATLGRFTRSHEECEAYSEQFARSFLLRGYSSDPTTDRLNADYVILDEAGARECIESTASLACDVEDPFCLLRHLIPVSSSATTTSMLGQPCGTDTQDPDYDQGTYNFTPCGSGLYCSAFELACGTCVEKQAAATSCTEDEQCLSGICEAGMCASTRVGNPGLGEACTGACTGNLVCAPTMAGSSQRTCQVRADLGQPCELTQCLYPGYCSGAAGSRTCVELLDDGASCTRTGTPCRNLCIYPSAAATSGTCGIPTSDPAPGAACYGMQFGTDCGALRRRVDAMGNCTCVTPLPDGAMCNPADNLCAHSCVSSMGGPGTCGRLHTGMDGAPCDDADDCRSRHCGLVDNTAGFVCRPATSVCDVNATMCPASPSNTMQGSATTLQLLDVGESFFCTQPGVPSSFWFRVTGNFTSSQALLVRTDVLYRILAEGGASWTETLEAHLSTGGGAATQVTPPRDNAGFGLSSYTVCLSPADTVDLKWSIDASTAMLVENLLSVDVVMGSEVGCP